MDVVGQLISLFIYIVALFNQSLCIYDPLALASDVGIYGGHEIGIKDASYMASLRLDNNHWCGASIIHKKYILTAAHCILPSRKYKVSVGTDNIQGGYLYDIEKIIVHENYNSTTYDYDVCVIKLNGTLEYSDTVNKIELAEITPPSGLLVKVSGWGKTPEKSLSDHLLQVSIPVIASRVCRLTYARNNFVITPRMFCAGDDGLDSCEADSGGPLIYKNKQVGIVSIGLQTCGVKPGVYTKVKVLREWILSTIIGNL